ncbi:MAG: hypothetical protein ACD_63C00145G0001 [uncultured bacterium]|nr:MAG: hypothetical protein ACD_63C00145G0001 [uncultured bacterium]
MSILIDKNSKFIIQGITGSQGSFHTKLMLEGGTKIAAGVVPGKAGKKVEGIPVYDKISDAMQKHEASWSILFVPASFVKAAALEALDAGLNIVIITEHIPVHDTLAIIKFAKEKGEELDKKLYIVGPNCPGLITPEESKAGILPSKIFKKGNVGVVSRSGTLTYEIVWELSKRDIGQSTCVGIGGDPVIGSDFIDILKLFEKDKDTKQIVLIGEIGGSLEERAAEYIEKNISKPVISYIAGCTAPSGKTMGHAGALVLGACGSAKSKIKALEIAGVEVAKLPSGVGRILENKIK